MTRVCFVAAGPIEWGSSRMRCYWPAQHIEGAQVVQFKDVQAGSLPAADVYVWQKNAHVNLIDALPDARHYWDLCDPLHWFSPDEARAVARRVDGLIASSDGLAADLHEWSGRPVEVVPDCLDLTHFEPHRRRAHQNGDVRRFVWFGVSVNRIALYGALAHLLRLRANRHSIELTILDDRPEQPMDDIAGAFPVYHARWNLRNEVQTIAAHDIALLPPYPGPWGQVKSDNKAQTAAACGLPAVTIQAYDEIESLVLSPALRDQVVRMARINESQDVAGRWQQCLQLS